MFTNFLLEELEHWITYFCLFSYHEKKYFYCVLQHFYELPLQLVKLGVKCNLGLSKGSQKRHKSLTVL